MKDYIQMRDRDFVKTALFVLSCHMRMGERISRSQLIEETLAKRPSGFFVSFTQALKIYSDFERHGLPAEPSMRQLMWMELYRKVRAVLDEYPKMSVSKAMTEVLSHRRPSRYFISEPRARKLLSGAVRISEYLTAII